MNQCQIPNDKGITLDTVESIVLSGFDVVMPYHRLLKALPTKDMGRTILGGIEVLVRVGFGVRCKAVNSLKIFYQLGSCFLAFNICSDAFNSDGVLIVADGLATTLVAAPGGTICRVPAPLLSLQQLPDNAAPYYRSERSRRPCCRYR